MNLFIVAIFAVTGLLFVYGNAKAESSVQTATRVLTVKDLPKLEQLSLRKINMGRDLRVCVARLNSAHSLFNVGETLGAAVGLFVGAFTLNPGTAIKSARAVSDTYNALKPKTDCNKELDQLTRDLVAHDALSRELGLSPDLAFSDITAIALRLNPIVRDARGRVVRGGYIF